MSRGRGLATLPRRARRFSLLYMRRPSGSPPDGSERCSCLWLPIRVRIHAILHLVCCATAGPSRIARIDPALPENCLADDRGGHVKADSPLSIALTPFLMAFKDLPWT